MSSNVKEKIIKMISPNSKLRQTLKLSNEYFQVKFVYAHCVMPEPRVKLLLIARRSYSVMLDAYAVITASMKQP